MNTFVSKGCVYTGFACGQPPHFLNWLLRKAMSYYVCSGFSAPHIASHCACRGGIRPALHVFHSILHAGLAYLTPLRWIQQDGYTLCI